MYKYFIKSFLYKVNVDDLNEEVKVFLDGKLWNDSIWFASEIIQQPDRFIPITEEEALLWLL